VRPRVKLSSGCGAGFAKEQALLHGLLELVERDAVALWWRGGRLARAPSPHLGQEAAAFLGMLRRRVSARVSWLLDITSDLGIPAVAALSTEETGRGLVCGFSAHLSYGQAMRGAILEMCQMELGLKVIEIKVAQDGADALGESDRKHWHRARTLDARGCPLLHPVAHEAGRANAFPGHGDPIDWVVDRLMQSGIEVYVVDLSRRQLGIAVMQALAPRLQPMPSDVVTERLAREIERSGGGFGLTNAIELI
jgi:ribosomal protein S12 methylthiotransferase accessory factor